MSSGETRQSLSRYTFCEVPKAEARALCLERHYSRTWNHSFGAYNYGMRDSNGKLIGVAVYGEMKNPASIASIADVRSGELVELNRLWIDDSAGRNAETQLMAYAHGELRRNTPVRIIQSFADGRLGVGTIYQAASFGYYGHHETLFYENIRTGRVHNSTSMNNTATREGMLLNVHLARGDMRAFRVDTYRYLKPLNKSYARRIRLERVPYPKVRRGARYIENYTPPVSQIARAYCIALIEGSGTAAELADYAHRLGMTGADVDDVMCNEWIVKYAAGAGLPLAGLAETMLDGGGVTVGGTLDLFEMGRAA